MMEFPIMHTLTALLYGIFGVHEIIGRIINITFATAAMYFFYRLSRRFLSLQGSLFSLGLFAFSPMNIFFGRTFMPEASMMFFCVTSVYFFLLWLEDKSIPAYWIALVCAGVSWLVKPTAGMILSPIFTAWFLRDRQKMLYDWRAWLFTAGSVLPVLAWALYSKWVNSLNPNLPQAFGGWLEILLERGGILAHWIDPQFYAFLCGSIGLLLLTPLGSLFFIYGSIKMPPGKTRTILWMWLGAVIAYFYVLAGANSGHIYYHIHLLPVSAIFAGYGIERALSGRTLGYVLNKIKLPFRVLSIGIIGLYIWGYAAFFSYMYEERLPYTLAASKMLMERAPYPRVLVVHQPKTAAPLVLSYYSKSKSWPLPMFSSKESIELLESFRARGATTYVAMESKYGNGVQATKEKGLFWKHLNKYYAPIHLSPHFLIFDLRSRIQLKQNG
jgi:4-amino-4-deoxy-L-arabinose transferase-like glycosyltransferase